MEKLKRIWSRSLIVLATMLALLVAGNVFAQAKNAKYMGAEKCKNCHSSASMGDQYGKWKAEKHSNAYDNLAGPKAKELGQKQGIADPQASDKCLKCHTTAFGQSKDRLDAKFDPKLGVQCESCHGPGEKHVKARMTAAAEGADALGAGGAPSAISKDEINTKPDAKTCTGCHNKESPSFTSFDFDKMSKEIAHPNPKKK